MRTRLLAALLSVLAIATLRVATLTAQQPIQRPRITGISHAAYFVSDLPKAIAFWHDLLGYDEPYDLKKPGTVTTYIAFIKINDHQHIELFNAPPTTPRNMMSHICFSVDNIQQMHDYLLSKGISVPSITHTRAGDQAFEIHDPVGTLVEFVQSLPTVFEANAAGKFAPPTRISPAIYHVGFTVSDAQKALDFYGNILGFKEIWRGSNNPKELSWINMKVPDGDDYVEFMLYHAPSNPDSWGEQNHVALVVPDMDSAVATLKSRPAFATYAKPINIKTGFNQKRQANLFDPDGTRVELMEPHTITGKPTPSSTLPPPAN